jgi:hypothetical protein
VHLARQDDRVPSGSRFVRLEGAGGDGGVKCYWELPDGAEWGWQSKLLRRLDKKQIAQSNCPAGAPSTEALRCLPTI